MLRSSDTVSIVLAEHEPKRFTPLPVAPGKLPDELNRLRRLKPGLSDASHPRRRPGRARPDHPQGRNTRKVIIVVSDAQRTGWQVESVTSWNAALGQRIKGVEPPVKMYELSIPPDAVGGQRDRRGRDAFRPTWWPRAGRRRSTRR